MFWQIKDAPWWNIEERKRNDDGDRSEWGMFWWRKLKKRVK